MIFRILYWQCQDWLYFKDEAVAEALTANVRLEAGVDATVSSR